MRRDTAIVLVLAGVVHLVNLWLAAADPAFASTRFDETDYLALAGVRPDPLAGAHADFLSPGFVVWVRSLAAIGLGSVQGIAAANCVAGTITVVVAYLLTRRCAGPAPALVAAMFLTLCGPVLFYETKVLPDTLLATTTVGSAWLWIRQRERPTAATAACFGALSIAMISLRGSHAIPALAMAADLAWSAWGRRPRARALLGAVLGSLLAVAVLRLGGAERLLATSGPINFIIGNGEGATGTWRLPPGLVVRGESARGLPIAAERLAAREPRAFGWSRAWSDVAADPIAWSRRLLHKAKLAVARTELPDDRFYEHERRFHPLLRIAPNGFVLLVLGTCGLVAMVARRRGSIRRLGVMGLLVAFATLVLFYVLGRYRVAWFPFLAIGMGVLIDTCHRAWRRRRRVTLLVLAVGAAALGWVAWTPPVPDDGRAEYLRGFDLHRAGELELAVEHYERALQRAGTNRVLAAEIAANLALARKTAAAREAGVVESPAGRRSRS